MPLAVEVRPMRQVLARLAIAAAAIIVGMVCFIIGAAKQSRLDQTQFTAWRNANACVEVPGFLREGPPNAKTNAKMHRVE
jgi:hypothetical protein